MFFTGQGWERKIQEKYPNFVTVLLKVILVFPFFYFWIWTYTQSCHFPSWIYCDSSFVPVITLTISFNWSRVCFLTTLQSVEIVIDYLSFRLAKIPKSDIFFKRKIKQNQVMLYIFRMQTVTLPMENLVIISRNTSYTCFYLAIHLYYSILKLFKPKRWKKYMNQAVNCSTIQLQDWKPPMCPSVEDLLNKQWFIYPLGYCKKDKIYLCILPYHDHYHLSKGSRRYKYKCTLADKFSKHVGEDSIKQDWLLVELLKLDDRYIRSSLWYFLFLYMY